MNENVKKETFKKQLTVEGIEEKNKNLYKKKNEENTIDDIINIVNENPEILDNLSILKLEKISSIYDRKIEELRMKIKRLKRTNN